MSEKKISYLNRTYEDYRTALRENSVKYYPLISDKLDDASIMSWLIDMTASIADNLSFHIDRAYGETNIDTASERSSVYALARSNGFKIPSAMPSIAEEKITCIIPTYSDGANNGLPDFTFAPIIKKGTKLTDGSQVFELTEDVDFSSITNDDLDPNIEITPINGVMGTDGYRLSKYTTVIAGESKVFKQIIDPYDVKPFMEIILPDKDVMNIESIIFKDSSAYNTTPTMSEFMNPNEFVPASESFNAIDTYRFFEVDSLLQQYRWDDDILTTKSKYETSGVPVKYTYGYYNVGNNTVIPTTTVVKGEWIPLTQKFITEYTDNGYLKIIFGSGEQINETIDYSKAKDFTKRQISKMVRNNFLGKLPNGGMSMFVLYRTGGGSSSNVPSNTINKILYLNAEFNNCLTNEDNVKMSSVRNSLTFTNTTPSVSGKDAPTVDEIKAMIKYNNAAQERCVTLKDYESRVMKMPPRYGSPFRIRAVEENNKVMLYLLGVDNNGLLTSQLPAQMVKNIINYLSMYRTINDFVEIKSGRIINISFNVNVTIDKNYDKSNVVRNIITVIKDYMDIKRHDIGEKIYVGDIEKEISKIEGVINLTDLKVYNEHGIGYSPTYTAQETYGDYLNNESEHEEINIEDSDYTLTLEEDEMFEIKYPEKDINVVIKLR